MPKSGGLVEWTLAQEPREEDGQSVPAHLEILDMTKDARWKDSSFVTAEPYFRYYCGLPLRTDNDINIGALFLLDTRPRESTSLARLKVLHTISHNIMVHMRTVKEAHEKQRAIYMNMCMADFINPAHRFRSRQLHPPRMSESQDAQRASAQSPSQLQTPPTPHQQRGGDYFRYEKCSDSTEASKSTMADTKDAERLAQTASRSSPGNSNEADAEVSAVMNKGNGRPDEPADDNEMHDAPPNSSPAAQTVHGDIQGDDEAAEQTLQEEDTQTSVQGSKFTSMPDLAGTGTVARASGRNSSQAGLAVDTKDPLGRERSSISQQEGDGSPRGRCAERSPTADSSASRSPKKNITEADHQRVFDRAAYLLRQALDIEKAAGGGVVLLDTNALADSTDPMMKRQPTKYDEINDTGSLSRQSSCELIAPVGHVTTPNQSKSAYSGTLRERVVLAAASIQPPSEGPPQNFGRADPTWKVTLTPPELARMCRKHPKGKLFNLPEDIGTSLFDWEGRPIMGRLSSQLYELVLLRRQFPDAKQVIFIPMFHANLNRWTSCLAYTNSRMRIFSYEMDYLPVLSFCNSIRAEIVRLATVFADQQKSDFIGSVSHELRSPLHGILASIEFLQDTECDGFQKSCIDTMDACAHTLLDTVAMVLDYNKVNTLKRKSSDGSSSQDSERQEPRMPTTTSLKSEPLFATDQECDIALIAEEVIDGLATGHLARHRTSVGFDEAPTNFNSSVDDGLRPELRRVMNAIRPEVELVLDIQGPSRWTFATQPGAIRRIVMNLFGNALKYTKHGYINVSLRFVGQSSQRGDQTVKFDQRDKPTIVKLTVTDTGQGISPEYLRTKIFTPFAQENAKSAGTGLGLSIVRNIVNMLQGEIDIKSILNVGTMVIVTLPMKKSNPEKVVRTASPTRIAGQPSSYQQIKDPSVSALQNLPNPPQAAIYEPAMEHDSFGQSQGAVAIHSALVQYLTTWFGFPTLQTWSFDLPATILIVDEIHLPTLLARRPDFLETLSRQSMIILCANVARQAVLAKDIQSTRVELVSKPFGPFKLAKALCRALEKAAKPPAQAAQFISQIDASAEPGPSAHSPPNVTPSGENGYLHPGIVSPLACHSKVSSAGTTPGGSSATPLEEIGHDGFPFPSKHTQQPSTQHAVPEMASKSRSPQRPRYTPSSRKPPPTTSSLRAHTDIGTVPRLLPIPNSERSCASDDLIVTADPSSAVVPFSIWDIPSTPQSRRPRLLLVDDNRLNLSLLHTFVKKRGFLEDLACTAEDGAQAVRTFEGSNPDIIFMDLSMPVMDGLEATRNIRRIEGLRRAASERDKSMTTQGSALAKYKQPALVVAITGNAKGSDQSEAFDAGIDVYLTKPVSFKEVSKLLANWRDRTPT